MSAVTKSRILRPRDDSPVFWEAWYNDRDLGKREAGVSWKEASETRTKGWKSLKLGPNALNQGIQTTAKG